MAVLDLKTTQFSLPAKRIFDSQTTQDFQSSIALNRLRFFLQKYISMVTNVQTPPEGTLSSVTLVNSIVQLLNHLSTLIDETPPLVGPRRYGNLACRDWHTKMEAQLPALLNEILDPYLPKVSGESSSMHPCIQELNYYISNAFGSSTRLDFGTGHELSFMAFIAAIDMLGLWTDGMQGTDILLLFNTYYALVRKLILTYTLEPAGSHGVWGLDDHFHLAYILGSSQWIRNAPMRPRDVKDISLVKQYAKSNLYCQCIAFIFQVKSGPFSEHSPILYDIATSVTTWSKVQRGLIKMYMDEVLKKFPVVQHFWFGDGFYPWINQHTGKPLPIYEHSPEDDETEQEREIQQYAPHWHKENAHVRTAKPGITAMPSVTNTRTNMAPPSSRMMNSHDPTISSLLKRSTRDQARR